ncbi:protein ripply3-like [Protopterus annectens]|uniref:protein ripply3-like n=1 Tax=Protopterus annectens TaxID=7888 RepID=UPI001CFBE95E|nr:protein ripply3-like [Protopterus annectens]
MSGAEHPWKCSSGGNQSKVRSNGTLGFQHPVRLCVPKSRLHEYLQDIGKKALASFPVQATISFYNDDSDSEEEESEDSMIEGLQMHRNGEMDLETDETWTFQNSQEMLLELRKENYESSK